MSDAVDSSLPSSDSPAPPARARLIETLLLLAVSLYLLTLVRQTVGNADAALYLTQLKAGDFSQRTIHIGYLLSAWPWVVGGFFAPSTSLNLLSVGWTTVSLLALVRLDRWLDPTRQVSLVPLCLVFSPAALLLATAGEVYPALLAFQLWAIVSWLEGRVMRAGLLGGLAILCSPTALTALPLLGLRRFHRLEVVRFGGVALLTCLPVIAYFRQDYLWGSRGILSTSMAFEPLDMLAYRLRQLPEVFQGGLLVLGAGLAFVPPASQERLKVLLREVVATVLLTLLVVDHFRDVPAQLLPMVLLTPLLSTGLAGLLERISLPSTDLRRWNPPILVVCGLLLCLAISADQQARAARRQELKFAEHCRRVAGLLEPDARVVGDFRERTLFEWYVDGWTGTGRTLSPEAAAQSRGAALYRLSLPAEPTALDRRLELKAPGLWLIQPEAGQPKP